MEIPYLKGRYSVSYPNKSYGFEKLGCPITLFTNAHD